MPSVINIERIVFISSFISSGLVADSSTGLLCALFQQAKLVATEIGRTI